MNTTLKSAFLALYVLISGCTVQANLKNVDTLKIPYDATLRSNYFNGANISFVVEGEKQFSGKPNTKLSGHLFLLELDLEMIQKESAKKVISNSLLFENEMKSNIVIISKMKNYRWVIRNVGLLSQVASVSFDLGIIIIKDGKEIYNENFNVNDYMANEAEYIVPQEVYLGPFGSANWKADKLAVSAFLGTSKILCEKYRNTLSSVR